MTRHIARVATALALALLTAAAARAGDVTASMKGQTLVVKGDNQGADLVLAPPIPLSRGASAGVTVQVTPQGATTLNGAAGAADFDGVVDVKMTLGDGANTVLLKDLSFDGSFGFKSGDGADTLTIQDTGFDDDVKVSLGNGANTLVLFAGSATGDDLTVKAGSGADTLTLSGPVGGTSKLSLGAGANTLTASGAVGDDFFYKGGTGAETVTLAGAVGGRAKVTVSHGANTVTLQAGTQIGEAFTLKGGADPDTVAIDAISIGDDVNLNLSSGDNSASFTDTTIGDDLIVKAKSGDDTVTFQGTVGVGGQTTFSLDGGANTTP